MRGRDHVFGLGGSEVEGAERVVLRCGIGYRGVGRGEDDGGGGGGVRLQEGERTALWCRRGGELALFGRRGAGEEGGWGCGRGGLGGCPETDAAVARGAEDATCRSVDIDGFDTCFVTI